MLSTVIGVVLTVRPSHCGMISTERDLQSHCFHTNDTETIEVSMWGRWGQ